MISRQKQIYELRKAVIDELKIRTVKKRMIAVLNNQQQVGSAKSKLQSVIQQMEYRKAVKVRKTAFDSETGFMYRATVEFEFVFQDSGYAKFLDIVPYSDIKYKSRGSGIENLIAWIKQKPISTWKNPYGIEEIKQDKKKMRRLAYAIRKSQDQRGDIKNKSNFITFTRSNITTAINKAKERFVNYLSDELYLEIERQIFFK
jgi:hypothetical protein